jgi:F-type H+-transporting ATPase subunit b
MNKLLLLTVLFTAALFGSDATVEKSTDIVWRTINFLVFAGIVYWLIEGHIRSFFGGRTAGIAAELNKVQERLAESKKQRDAALQKIEEAKQFVSELSEITKKECKILADKIIAQCDQDIDVLEKQSNALMGLEKRQMVRSVVNEIMGEVMIHSDANMTNDTMMDILKKKVA